MKKERIPTKNAVYLNQNITGVLFWQLDVEVYYVNSIWIVRLSFADFSPCSKDF